MLATDPSTAVSNRHCYVDLRNVKKILPAERGKRGASRDLRRHDAVILTRISGRIPTRITFPMTATQTNHAPMAASVPSLPSDRSASPGSKQRTSPGLTNKTQNLSSLPRDWIRWRNAAVPVARQLVAYTISARISLSPSTVCRVPVTVTRLPSDTADVLRTLSAPVLSVSSI